MKNYMFEKLLQHRGHTLECVSYGDLDDPVDVCVECVDCNEVLVSAEDFNDPSEEERQFYAYFFPGKDGDPAAEPGIVNMTHTELTCGTLEAYRQNVASFQAQPKGQESYVDKWGVIHIVTAHEDRPFAYYFEVIDECWEDVLGEMGALLDDSENKDMPEEIRKGFSCIYSHAHSKVFPKKPPVARPEVPEFTGQIIDIVEDFLEERGITLNNPEIEEAIADGQDPEGLAIIYGTDYGDLQSEIEAMMIAWGVVEPEPHPVLKQEFTAEKEVDHA